MAYKLIGYNVSDETNIPSWMFQALGGLLTVFGFGKAWGSLVQKDREQGKRIVALEQEIESTRAVYDAKIIELSNMFLADGEPKFITYRAHDKLQEVCQRHIASELSHIRDTCEDIKKTVNQRSNQ